MAAINYYTRLVDVLFQNEGIPLILFLFLLYITLRTVPDGKNIVGTKITEIFDYNIDFMFRSQ